MRPRRCRAARLLLAGLAGAALAAGCGAEATAPQQPATTMAATRAAGESSAVSQSPTAAADGSESAAAENRPEVLLLEGAQLDGQQFDFAATAGNDVLLWFWAPW